MQGVGFELANTAGQVIVESVLPAQTPSAGSLQPPPHLNFRHRWQTFFSQQLSVFSVADQDYVLGVQIANLLNRETFNLYRSLKVMIRIPLHRADAYRLRPTDQGHRAHSRGA